MSDSRKDFGAQAIEMGFCTQAQVEDARATEEELQKLGLPDTLSSILVRKGYLKSEQVAAVERALSGPPVLAGYEILEKVGQGGMGAKWVRLAVFGAGRTPCPDRVNAELWRGHTQR